MYEIKTYQDKMKDKFISNLTGMFPNISKRLAVWAETEKYHWKEDESVWNQKRGKTAPQYEVHLDGEFVCFLDSGKSDRYNLSEFLLNVKKLYMEGRLYIHPEMYEVKAAEVAELTKPEDLVVPKPQNEAESVIVEVIKKQAKKRKRKVKLK